MGPAVALLRILSMYLIENTSVY